MTEITPEQFDSAYLMAEIAAVLDGSVIAGGAVTLDARYNDLEVIVVGGIDDTYTKRFMLDVAPIAPEPGDVHQTLTLVEMCPDHPEVGADACEDCLCANCAKRAELRDGGLCDACAEAEDE